MIAAVFVAIAAVVIILVLNSTSASAENDKDVSRQADPNYPPPPSLGTFGDQAIETLVKGISFAEGFGRFGAIPTRAHNPGDLVIPNWQGQTLGAEKISVFSGDAEGFNRLRHQLYLIGSEQSKVYNLDMTIADMAHKWTRTDPVTWAADVQLATGIAPDTVLRDLFAGTAS